MVVGCERKENYPFFEKEMAAVLQSIDTEGKTIGQFCCNNGRELLSLVKSGKAARGIGFDIAENQVVFANEKAKELNLPCIKEIFKLVSKKMLTKRKSPNWFTIKKCRKRR